MSMPQCDWAVRSRGARSMTACALVTAEDEAIEAIGDLRELLEVEDLLLSAVPPPERGDHS